MSVKLISDEKIAVTSSKGNQEKWFNSTENRWYKLDQYGYESLSEVVISRLLADSNIEKDFPFRFVRYKMESVNAHGRERVGCSSQNFLTSNKSIMTLGNLYKKFLKKPLILTLERLSSDKKRIAWLADETAEVTRLSEFATYLTLLFEIDALFLNDDRHLNNIAVIEQDGHYEYCPIFDNGAALLSNSQIFRFDIDPAAHIRAVRSRPFNMTFNRQIIAARERYGCQLQIPKIEKNKILDCIEDCLEFYPDRDRGIISDRVCTCILARQKAQF